MNQKQFFYLEPYTFIKRGNNSVLLVNMLDDNCQACSLQWLCPAPSYIEDYLRENEMTGCLLSDNVPNEKVGEHALQ